MDASDPQMILSSILYTLCDVLQLESRILLLQRPEIREVCAHILVRICPNTLGHIQCSAQYPAAYHGMGVSVPALRNDF